MGLLRKPSNADSEENYNATSISGTSSFGRIRSFNVHRQYCGGDIEFRGWRARGRNEVVGLLLNSMQDGAGEQRIMCEERNTLLLSFGEPTHMVGVVQERWRM